MDRKLDIRNEFPRPEYLEGAAPLPLERLLAMVGHLGGALTCFVVPTLLYVTQRDKSAFVVRHACEALNHQITLGFTVLLVCALIAGIPAVAHDWRWSLVVALAALLAVALLVLFLEIHLVIRACQAAWKGRDFRYPLTLRLIRP